MYEVITKVLKRHLFPLHAPGMPFHTQYYLHRHSVLSDDFWRRIYFVVVFNCSFICSVPLKRYSRDSVTFNLVEHE